MLKNLPQDLFGTVTQFAWNIRLTKAQLKRMAARLEDMQHSIPDPFKTDNYYNHWLKRTIPNPLLELQPFSPVDFDSVYWHPRVNRLYQAIDRDFFRPGLKGPVGRHLMKPLPQGWDRFLSKIKYLTIDNIDSQGIFAWLYSPIRAQSTPELRQHWRSILIEREWGLLLDSLRFAQPLLRL